MPPSVPSIVKTPQLKVRPWPKAGTISPATATIQTGASSSAAGGLYAPGSPLARYSRHVISFASIRSIRRTSAESFITALVARGCWTPTAIGASRRRRPRLDEGGDRMAGQLVEGRRPRLRDPGGAYAHQSAVNGFD